MDGKMILSRIINSFFNGLERSALVEQCPNGMLWEAIKRENARDIDIHGIFAHLSTQDEFYLLPEPIPAMRNGFDPVFMRVKSEGLLRNDQDPFGDFIWKEPTYLVSCDFKWMIAMTTENTANGDQLCVFVCAKW